MWKQTTMSDLLLEGGNVFKDDAGTVLTKRINKADVLPTIQWLETVTGLELTDHLLGTTGKKETSGDLDIAIDANEVNKNEFAQKLADYIAKQGGNPKEWIKKSGISVHFKTPIKGEEANGYVQSDFMFGERDWLKFSLQGGREGSELKGAHRHVILSSIARHRGMKWSPNNGLMSGDGKELVTKDANEIAKKLLGQTATVKDLADPEAIIDYIIKLPAYEELVADARETLGREGVKLPVAGKVESFTPGSGAWFRKMIEVVK
jgi:hypothetical protein